MKWDKTTLKLTTFHNLVFEGFFFFAFILVLKFDNLHIIYRLFSPCYHTKEIQLSRSKILILSEYYKWTLGWGVLFYNEQNEGILETMPCPHGRHTRLSWRVIGNIQFPMVHKATKIIQVVHSWLSVVIYFSFGESKEKSTWKLDWPDIMQIFVYYVQIPPIPSSCFFIVGTCGISLNKK